MNLGDFSGGLQTRLSPRKLAGNQATVCTNVDFKSTDLKPFNTMGDDYRVDLTGQSFVSFKDEIYTQTSTSNNLPIFLPYLDDLYCIKDTVSPGVLSRLIDGEFRPAGYKRNIVDISATGQLLQTASTTVTSIATAETLGGWSHQYPQEPGKVVPFPHLEKESPQLNLLMSRLTGATYSLGTTGSPAIFKTEIYVDAITDVVKVVNFAPGVGTEPSLTYTDYLIHYKVKYTKDGVDVLPGSADHTAIVAGMAGFDYETAQLDTNINLSTGLPHSPYTIPFQTREVSTSSTNEYTYVFTFYSSVADFETSYLGEITTVTSHESLSNDIVITIDTGATAIYEPGLTGFADLIAYFDKGRLYRSGNGATVPTLVKEFNLSTDTAFINATQTQVINYTDLDLTEDSYLTAGRLFDTLDVGEVPSDITHGIEVGNRIVLASGNKIYPSEIGNQDSFPLTNVVAFNEDIVALAESSRGLLVFFKTKTYLVNLSTTGTFSKILLSADQGCTTHLSVQHIKNTPYWFSVDGFCTLYGDKVKVLSKRTLDKDTFTLTETEPYALTTVVASGQEDERYFAVLHNDNAASVIFTYDMSYERSVPYFIEPQAVQVTNFANLQGKLYCVVLNHLRKMFGGDGLEEYTYKTGLLTQGTLSKRKLYDDIYVFTLDDNFVKITVLNEKNEIMAIKTANKAGLHNIKVKANKDDAYGIQFLFEGSARVAEVEFSITGRANGR